MVFSSLFFLYVFLPVVLLLYFLAPKKVKNIVLLIVSLVFYAWGEPVYIFLMAASIVFNFIAGLLMEKKEKYKKAVLVCAVILNLGLLAVFKYTDMVIGTFDRLFSMNIKLLHIALPIGISFYTFQALSYVIDVYRKKTQADHDIIAFGAYISMFPQLIAGPIVRYSDVRRELKSRRVTSEDFEAGIMRFVCGLGKKVLIANNIGKVWKAVSGTDPGELSTAYLWLGLLAFTFQIYFDFSGYSDMAIGLGRMLGFHFLENFDHPYISTSITEFWRRWHISLSSWFKEYLYIPLGGNRKGPARQIFNIFTVWLLTGLWHGASWNFVLWGLFYAVFLLIEKFFLKRPLEKAPKAVGWIYTMIIVVIGWGIFSMSDIPSENIMNFIKTAFFKGKAGIGDSHAWFALKENLILFIVSALGSTGVPAGLSERILRNRPVLREVLSIVFMLGIMILCTAFMVSDKYNPFLYFRF